MTFNNDVRFPSPTIDQSLVPWQKVHHFRSSFALLSDLGWVHRQNRSTICLLPRHKHFTLERALEVNQPSVIIFPQFRFVFLFSVSFPALHFTNVSLFVQELTFQELSHNLPNRNGKPLAVSVHSLLLTSTTPSAS